MIGNSFRECQWKDIRVGDVLQVLENEFFSADLLLLKSSESKGKHFLLGLLKIILLLFKKKMQILVLFYFKLIQNSIIIIDY